jgi:hypothetical protein
LFFQGFVGRFTDVARLSRNVEQEAKEAAEGAGFGCSTTDAAKFAAWQTQSLSTDRVRFIQF